MFLSPVEVSALYCNSTSLPDSTVKKCPKALSTSARLISSTINHLFSLTLFRNTPSWNTSLPSLSGIYPPIVSKVLQSATAVVIIYPLIKLVLTASSQALSARVVLPVPGGPVIIMCFCEFIKFLRLTTGLSDIENPSVIVSIIGSYTSVKFSLFFCSSSSFSKFCITIFSP